MKKTSGNEFLDLNPPDLELLHELTTMYESMKKKAPRRTEPSRVERKSQPVKRSAVLPK